jgi:hypothetical protein
MTIQSHQRRPVFFANTAGQLKLFGAAIIVLLVFALSHVW